MGHFCFILVGAAGFEPTLTESESGVLPLNYAPRPVDYIPPYFVLQTKNITRRAGAFVPIGQRAHPEYNVRNNKRIKNEKDFANMLHRRIMFYEPWIWKCVHRNNTEIGR